MASCVTNIHTKSYQNLIIGFQVTVENVGDASFGTQCRTTFQIIRDKLMLNLNGSSGC